MAPKQIILMHSFCWCVRHFLAYEENLTELIEKQLPGMSQVS